MSELLGRAQEIKAAKDREAAERQRLLAVQAVSQAEAQRVQDAQEALWIQESNQRAREAVTLLVNHRVSTVKLYGGTQDKTYGSVSKRVRFGEGWVITDPYNEHYPWDGGYPVFIPGQILLTSGTTCEWDVRIDKSGLRSPYVLQRAQDIFDEGSYTPHKKQLGIPLKHPYSGDKGLEKLGNALVRYGVTE